MTSWKAVLRTNFTDIDKLADFLNLSEADRACLHSRPRFILNLPLRLASKMQKGTLKDPLLRQFVPLLEEERRAPGFVPDPVQDVLFQKDGKLLQKYPARALVISTSACAMHCRYCFRQNYPYETEVKGFEKELATCRQDKTLREIILSGGDPLSLSNELLKELLDALDRIPHLKRIRFHTRFPIGIPERIDDEFLSILASLKKQVWFVVHSNHPLELDEEVLASLKRIQKLGIPILNQSVLLNGVNDELETLTALCERLTDHGFLPYYLHQLDRVQGTSHFEAPPKEG